MIDATIDGHKNNNNANQSQTHTPLPQRYNTVIMNLRAAALYFSCAVLLPSNVQAQSFFKGIVYNLDRFLEYITFGLIDIKDDDILEEIDSDLPGGLVFGGVCDRLKNLAIDFAIKQTGAEIPVEVEGIIDSIKCGCDVVRLGGESKFGCNFQEPVCQNISLGSVPIFRALQGTTAPTPSPSTIPTAAPTPGFVVPEGLGICATASVRADFNRRTALTPFEAATLETSACAELISATFYPNDIPLFPPGVTIPKICGKIKHADGLLNILNVTTTLESCDIFVVRPDKTVQACAKCEICGESGLGVSFDCSNVNFDNSGQTNITLPSFADTCLGSGSIPLGKLNDPSFVYRPFLSPMPWKIRIMKRKKKITECYLVVIYAYAVEQKIVIKNISFVSHCGY